MDTVSENVRNNKYAHGKYIVDYDDFLEVWNVKDTTSNVQYPMTSENMCYEIAILLNYYDMEYHKVLNELFKKDRKLEELGYDLNELDKME